MKNTTKLNNEIGQPTSNNGLLTEGSTEESTHSTKIHEFDFYRDSTGWYIDFPEFLAMGLGTKADLAMVAGADTMLEYLGGGRSRVTMNFSDQEIPNNQIQLKMSAKNGWGATYTTNIQEIPTVWLCNVTKVIFQGTHPTCIYAYVL